MRDDQYSKISEEIERRIKFETNSGLTDSGLANSGLTDSWVADSGFADLMLNDSLKTSISKDKKRRIIINGSHPFYVEVSLILAHGNASYVDVDFFKKSPLLHIKLKIKHNYGTVYLRIMQHRPRDTK